jgi:hypothetical protein
MNWMNIVEQLFTLVIIPLLGIGTIYLIGLIKTKKKAILDEVDSELVVKYVNFLE